jgi:ubiquitin related modifier 1
MFRGGLELLFAHKRNFAFSLPKRFGQPSQNANINFLIKQLCDREMKDPRRDLFIKDDTVYHPRAPH